MSGSKIEKKETIKGLKSQLSKLEGTKKELTIQLGVISRKDNTIVTIR